MIKKGDKVMVIAGKNKGAKGAVLKVLTSTSKVVVDGLNLYKKHMRPTREGGQGSVVEVSRPMHISNVALIDPKSSKPTRVGHKMIAGKKVRVAVKSGQEI